MTEEEARKLTASRRSYLRRIGVDVPVFIKGMRKGFKQSQEHIAKRIKSGPDHQNWKGDEIHEKSGRTRALRLYPKIGPCTICGNKKSERHHRDGNTLNNSPFNIAILCRKCHMTVDGRIKTFNKNRHNKNK
jgi:hypothetical protein